MPSRTAMYAGSISPDRFPLAPWYQALADRDGDMRVHEPAGPPLEPFRERHLQCVWYDSALRPRQLLTIEGEPVVVEAPGVWNLEAGPDFLGACVRVGGRRMAGDAEVHVRPHDWIAHGHAADPRYANVRIHIAFYPGAVPADRLPTGCIQIALKESLQSMPGFSFEAIDLLAYPLAARAAAPPCRDAWPSSDPEARIRLLDAAGEERVRRKALHMAALIRERGEEQALYEEVVAALGYKQNKTVCRRLAQTVEVSRLREQARGEWRRAYAVLLGVAGLMPATLGAGWDTASRRFVRALWDDWFALRPEWEGLLLDPALWVRSGIRPANHPLRRLAAAAAVFTQPESLADRLARAVEDGRPLATAAEELLEPKEDIFWHRRLGLGSARGDSRIALVGRSRALAIAVNVFVPHLAAAGRLSRPAHEVLAALPGEETNQIVRQTALSLFGPDASPRLYRDALRRQGLIQVFQDFCMNDRSRCASCPLPNALAAASPLSTAR